MASNRSIATGLTAAAAAGLLAACSGGNGSTAAAGGGPGTSQAGGTTIATRSVAGVGTVLTDQAGKTLYTPQQEANGAIKCTAGCLSFWFPVTVGSGVTPHASTALTGKLGSIKRSDDGMRQLTYNGKPLYTFRLDAAPGEVKGNDFSDHFGSQSFTWHAVTSSGAATGGQPASTPSYNPYPSGNSGY